MQQLRALGVLLFYFASSMALTMFNKWFFSESKSASLLASDGLLLPHLNDTSYTTAAAGTATTTNTPIVASSSAPAPPHHSAWHSSAARSGYGFHFPLTVTCLHQCLVFALVLLTEKNILKKYAGEITRSDAIAKAVIPIGIMSGLDWGLSNTSLRWIPLTLYELVKCCSPLVVMALGVWLNIQPLTPETVAVIATLCFGMWLSVTGGDVSIFAEKEFPMLGFLCVSGACLLSGGRVVVAQKVLQHGTGAPIAVGTSSSAAAAARSDEDAALPHATIGTTSTTTTVLAQRTPLSYSMEVVDQQQQQPSGAGAGSGTNSPSASSPPGGGLVPTVNTATMLYYAAPSSCLVLILPALMVEGANVNAYFATHSASNNIAVLLWIVGSALLAYALSLSEYTLTRVTSALTLSVCGIAKQLLIIGLAILFFHEVLGTWNTVGMVISTMGLLWFNWLKTRQRRHAAVAMQKLYAEEVEMEGEGEVAPLRR